MAHDELTLDVEKPAAGGRMLARHQGQVVLVWGAIPGERVRARVERAGKGVIYADTVEVVSASPDRRDGGDWRCGGNVLAHVAYPRQVTLKAQIIQDALGRIGRVPLPEPPPVVPSPEEGYRMRARLHVRGGRIGFFREGTHDLCDAAATRQLLPETHAWIRRAAELLRGERAVAAVEFAENVPADERAHHLEPVDAAAERRVAALTNELGPRRTVTDTIAVTATASLTLTREVRAFFQGNRFLIERMVREVVAQVPDGPAVDLYAGVGLFGLSLAAAGATDVTLVEGDATSGADLQRNAAPFGDRVRVERRSVEQYLAAAGPARGATVVIDPPRTGMTRDAVRGILRLQPARIVYVSCDVATLARDTRLLLDADYTLADVRGLDLFPNTAHVETICTYER